MTKEQILALGANRDTDGLIAIEYFAWRWYLDPKRNLVVLYPPEISGWTRWNFYPDMVLLGKTHEGYNRFEHWDNLASPETDYFRLTYMPEFSKDMSAAWQVADKVIEKEYGKITIDGSHYHGFYVWAADEKIESGKIFVPNSNEVPLAICKAALMLCLEE